MKTLSSTDVRANLFAAMNRVKGDHEPAIVSHAKGRPVVMGIVEDWASRDETT